MAAAAKHLTPVTLELGGKSPAIVAADANIEVAARRIAWGKFVNAGQTCVAPDYVLVRRVASSDEFVDALAAAVTDVLRRRSRASHPTTRRIVNERHFDRLMGLLDGGGYDRPSSAGTGERDSEYVAPTVLAGVKPDAAVMDDEIFGPILPVLTVGRHRRGDPLRERAREAARAVRVQLERRRLDHDRRPAHRRAGSRSTTCVLHLAVPDLPSAASGRAAWAPTTARPASTPSPTPSRCSTSRHAPDPR